MPKSVIITCAVTGGIHTPTMSPYLPIKPSEIAAESITAADAGASIIHLHARDPKTGQPTADPKVFMEFLPVIKDNCDDIINISTGGGTACGNIDDGITIVFNNRQKLHLSLIHI